jgi:toxin ParE1/3/4
MAHISRFRQAEEDMLAIAQYIAADNPTAAANWLDKNERTLALLASQPYLGEAVNHIRPGLRRISQGNYLLFYEPTDDGIILVRVLHGAREIESLF